ncbi:hypothetical protein HanXRQr2_Chr15g0710611 [Helianthus annuus]|uniref:Uncharacterized protein n=1 Tax=Helianthus annuus TaxID=4232 RepID=A0A9K3E330_HELAN|nr:hypothetical protein HanXRQr2_Chr15g0710611 [Helianthus annuus]KAJ0832727.1 hypothetical protein HanPSC8_Chr15g0682001 [Helianthus annuus]
MGFPGREWDLIIYWTLGTYGACTGEASRCGQWIMNAMFNISNTRTYDFTWVIYLCFRYTLKL